MTGAGAPGAAGILKCLHQEPSFRVFIADANPEASGKFLHAEFDWVPPGTDSGFVDGIQAICRERKINIVMPLVTRELIPLAARADEFKNEGIELLLSPLESLTIANNKSALYEFLQWRGIPVPGFRVVETAEQFESALSELGFPGKNICFKPSISNGSRGFRVVTEKVSESEILFNQKPNATFISKTDAVRILRSAPFPQLLISEYLPGPEYSVDCLARHGEPVLIVPRLRKKMINGISVEGEFIEEKNIIAYCENVIRSLKLHGNIGIQVKGSESEEFLILEINPRLQGTVSAALGAGINFPVLAVKQQSGLPVLPEELQVKWGTRFSRYWNEVFH